MPQVRSSRLVRLLAAGAAGVAAVAVLPAASAQAASFTLTVKGGYNDTLALGTATGTVTGPAGSAQASYSVTLCGDNTYPSSRVIIKGGTATAEHSVYLRNCEAFSGDLVSSYGFNTVDITVSGSTFYPGNVHKTYTRTLTVSFR